MCKHILNSPRQKFPKYTKAEKVEHIEKEEKATNAHTTPTQQKTPEVSTNTPRSFANTTIAHSKFLMCIDAKFPHTPICTPKFHNAPKSKVSGNLKRPSKFRDVYPSPQTDTLQFLNLQNHLSRSQKVTKRHLEFLYTHEVREFLTIQRPNAPQPNTHTTPPKHFEVSDCLQNPHLSRENFTPWELDLSTARATANEHHILLTSSVSAPHAVQCSLAAASARHLQLHQFTPQNHGSELLLCPSGRAVALRACDQAHYSESRIVRP